MRKAWIIFLLGTLLLAARNSEAQRGLLGEVRTVREKISGTFNARISVPKGLGTSLGEAVARSFSGNIAERYDEFYIASFDLLTHATKAARYAEEFAKKNDPETAVKYLDKANRYIRMSQYTWDGASEQLDATFSVAHDVVVYKAAGIVLGFAAGGLGTGIVWEGVSLYTDYLLDKELVGVDEAKKNLIKGALLKAFLNAPIDGLGGKSLSDAINKGVTKTIGGSGLYSYLDRLMGKPELQKEFLRIVADGLGYTAEWEAEWLMEKLFETPVAKRAGYRPIFDTTVPKDTKNLLYKATNFDASKTIKNTFTKVEPYLPTTTKALVRRNEQDSTRSIAGLDPGQPGLNVSQATLASLIQPGFTPSTIFHDNFESYTWSLTEGGWITSGFVGASSLLDSHGLYAFMNPGAGTSASMSHTFTLSELSHINTSFDYMMRAFNSTTEGYLSATLDSSPLLRVNIPSDINLANYESSPALSMDVWTPNTGRVHGESTEREFLTTTWSSHSSNCVPLAPGSHEVKFETVRTAGSEIIVTIPSTGSSAISSPSGPVVYVDDVNIKTCQP